MSYMLRDRDEREYPLDRIHQELLKVSAGPGIYDKWRCELRRPRIKKRSECSPS